MLTGRAHLMRTTDYASLICPSVTSRLLDVGKRVPARGDHLLSAARPPAPLPCRNFLDVVALPMIVDRGFPSLPIWIKPCHFEPLPIGGRTGGAAPWKLPSARRDRRMTLPIGRCAPSMQPNAINP